MSSPLNLTGQTFGRFTVGEKSKSDDSGSCWVCRCSCGTEKIIRASHLQSGRVVSCGCFRKEQVLKAHTKHGDASAGNKAPEYFVWRNMIYRVTIPVSQYYKDYGGRGITICDEWLGKHGYENFIKVMGRKPTLKHSLDRINNDGNYEPSNCRWATASEQGRNKRLSPKNKTGIAGVTLKKGRYYVYVSLSGIKHYIGSYIDINDARKARIEGEKKYWGYAQTRGIDLSDKK